jgi:hypothetical protein
VKVVYLCFRIAENCLKIRFIELDQPRLEWLCGVAENRLPLGFPPAQVNLFIDALDERFLCVLVRDAKTLCQISQSPVETEKKATAPSRISRSRSSGSKRRRRFGSGDLAVPLALVGLLLAIAEAARYGQGGQRPKRVTLVVFRRGANSTAEVDTIVVQRTLALIASKE